MGGTLRGKVDCFHNTGLRYTNTQQCFKNIYDFCIAHPNMSLIARHGGVGSIAGSIDYWDGANPFLSHAWFVVRMNDATLESGAANPTGYSGPRTYPWYMYCQWWRADVNATVGTAPASPAQFDGVTNPGGSSAGVGVTFAIAVGSTPGTSEVAWNGAGTLGQNTKGTPVWRTTAGTPTGFLGTLVYPRSNNTGGSHSTNRENMSRVLLNGVDTPVRQSVMADDDSIVFLTNTGDDHTSWQFQYFGLYTPRSGYSPTYPMVQIADPALPWTAGQNFGNTTGTAGGGIAPSSLANGVRGFNLGRVEEWLTQSASPNWLFANETFDLWDVPIIVAEAPFVGLAGNAGGSPMTVREVFGFGPADSNTAKTVSAYGAAATPQEIKVVVPWNGTTFPRANFTRDGLSF